MLLRAAASVALLAPRAAPAVALQDARPAGYSHEQGAVASNPSWMQHLDDSRTLSELSLPGTHDTMSLHGGVAAMTQSMGLAEQLHSGIRAIDIRCAHISDACAIHHGIVDQRIGLDAVLLTLADFLAAHPTEAVLMRLSVGGPAPSGNSRSWEETWASYVQRHNAMRTGAQGPLIWPDTHGHCRPCLQNPALGEIRGKVVILQDFGIRWPACFGVPYPDALIVQDNWRLESIWDLYQKWDAVKSMLDEASSGPASRVYMNYLSAASGGVPYFVASGQQIPNTGAPRLITGKTTWSGDRMWPDFPRVNCIFSSCDIAFEGTNILTALYLTGKKKRVGVIMADFPGPDLIDRIIAQNQLRQQANEPLHL